MRILYLGLARGTSLQRANAMRRLGHDVHVVDDEAFGAKGRLAFRLEWETAGLLSQRRVERQIFEKAGPGPYDVVWVDHGRLIGPGIVESLRKRFGAPVANYNADDPYGPRDRFSWLSYRRAVKAYDLMVVVREPNVAEAKALGARRVERIYRLADEVAHAPRELTKAQWAEYGVQVGFIGTGFENRGAFIADLVKRGVPLSIRGNAWERQPEWPILESHWAGPNSRSDEEYALAILGAQISLGLVSAANRDLHTSRSLEIPYMGGVFCAKRTSEHLGLYVEGEEALFWDDAAECAEVCSRELADPERLRTIARQGMERARRNGHLNEPVLSRLLEIVKP